jgi:hypothetical protein
MRRPTGIFDGLLYLIGIVIAAAVLIYVLKLLAGVL